MNFKIIKSIYIILLIVILITIPTQSYAFGELIENAGKFLEAGQGQDEIIKEDAFQKISDTVYNIFLVVSIIVAIGWGAFLGIKLMMEGAEGKAQIKEALLPYVVGCILGFSAFGIWKIVVEIAQNLEM